MRSYIFLSIYLYFSCMFTYSHINIYLGIKIQVYIKNRYCTVGFRHTPSTPWCHALPDAAARHVRIQP